MINIIRRVYNRFYKPSKPYSQIEVLKKKGLKIGENFDMQGGCIIDSSHCWHIQIGDNVTLAPRVHILAHDASTKKFFGYVKIGKVVIGNNVFIGASSIILPGVYIGNNVVIAAGSVVTKDIPDDTVAAGNPCKKISSCKEFIEKRKKEMQEYPTFGEEYTLRAEVSDEMKDEMNNKMKDRFGYIR